MAGGLSDGLSESIQGSERSKGSGHNVFYYINRECPEYWEEATRTPVEVRGDRYERPGHP